MSAFRDRILIVDDEESIGAGLTALLEDDWDVRTAETGLRNDRVRLIRILAALGADPPLGTSAPQDSEHVRNHQRGRSQRTFTRTGDSK